MATKDVSFSPEVINGKIRYVCHEVVNSDYALHLERKEAGKLYFYVKSTEEGQYCRSDISFFLQNNSDEVFDFDFTHIIYPKYLRIVSDTEVLSAKLITIEE